jgi:hypothetical protein
LMKKTLVTVAAAAKQRSGVTASPSRSSRAGRPASR